LQIENNASVRQ